MATITRIGVHHSGPPAGFNYTSEDIERYHRQKWNMISSLGRYGGYNISIAPDGTAFQHRAIGEQTIGATGFNFDTIHICLIGDFSKDMPTLEQKTRLKNILVSFIKGDFGGFVPMSNTVLKIKVKDIVPHRVLTPTTECFGRNLPDNFGQELVKDYISELQRMLITIIALYRKMVSLKKLGGRRPECELTQG